MTARDDWQSYISLLHSGNYVKLARLDFLQPDGSVAFMLDNNALNKRAGAFVQEGTLSVNLQNGQRRKADVTLSNLDGAYDYQINKVWFGQQVRLMMGVLLPDGRAYYIPQGIFYIQDPEEVLKPGQRSVTYTLVDKAAYLDGTLFGNLDGIYEVARGENIFEAITTLLQMDKGNGTAIDGLAPIFTDYYTGKTVELPDGTNISVLETPYTYRCESDAGTYWEIIKEMAVMLSAWIGYDSNGHLRLTPSNEDMDDITKPVLWDFTPDEVNFLGATYTVNASEVFNDIIVIGEALDDSPQPRGRATNTNVKSDTESQVMGLRTKMLTATGYYADEQCQELAEWYLKRYTVLQKSVTIECGQIFHIEENELVTIKRTDKDGSPVEKHLVTGFTLPIGQVGAMTINATSVNDLSGNSSYSA